MNILLLDASTQAEIISVKNNELLYDFSGLSAVSHSKTLFTRMESCLVKAGLTIKDIDLIAAGVGPGSFTGIRIAVSTARMLAQVLGIKAVKLPSQYIFALSADSDEGDFILPAFDAKKGRVFGALYKKSNSTIETVIPPGDYLINRMLEKIPQGAKTIFMGDGCGKFRDIIEKINLNKKILENYLPSGINSLKYLDELSEKGKLEILNYERIVPDYTRKSDAEIAMESGKV